MSTGRKTLIPAVPREGGLNETVGQLPLTAFQGGGQQPRTNDPNTMRQMTLAFWTRVGCVAAAATNAFERLVENTHPVPGFISRFRSVICGWMVAFACLASVIMIRILQHRGKGFLLPALGVTLLWFVLTNVWAFFLYRKHGQTGHQNQFVFFSVVGAISWLHTMPWTQSLSFEDSFVLIPPSVSFGLFTSTMYVEILASRQYG